MTATLEIDMDREWLPPMPTRPERVRMAVNEIARERTGRRVIPPGSTYRVRGGTFVLDGIRVLPSYLQAGPAWYVEATKRRMIADDLALAHTISGIAAVR